MTDTQSQPADQAEREPRRRLRRQPRQILLLALVWLVLVGEVSFVTVVGGLLISWLITLVFPLPPVEWAGRPNPLGILQLVGHLVKDLAVASVRLAAFAFGRQQPSPGIVRVTLNSDSDLYQVNTAELVSVVPGTLVVDARRRSRTLYLHVFDLPDPALRDAVDRDTHALERRVVRALGSKAEYEALDHPRDHGEPQFKEVS
ncbi:MAG: Na+/H+ antiporter subunit E [Propionibacteriaceae bacterium]|nr:Na+/H+ antiporter subunit E [Propionibacteriaceae bacterium]